MKRVHGKLRIIPVVLGLGLIVSLVVLLTGCWPFNTAPVASFTVSALSGEAPLSLSFSAILSYDPDGIIVKFEWDFGDGASGSGEAASHTYTTSGSFTVVLRVTDNNGATDTASKTIAVNEAEEPGGAGAGPTASFTATPLVGAAPLTATFNASASFYTGHAITYYSWDFGDGVTGTGMTTTHTYAPLVTTTYNVVLRIIASDNTEGTATKAIVVTVIPATPGTDNPTASFTTAPNKVVAPRVIVCDGENSAAAAGRTLTEWIWRFGDGTSPQSKNNDDPIEHRYVTDRASEIFTITLIVIDDENGTDTEQRTVTIENKQPVAGFEILDLANVVAPPGAGTWVADDVDFPDTGDPDIQTDSATIWIKSDPLPAAWEGDTPVPNDGTQDDPDPMTGEPGNYDDHDMCYDPEGQGWDAGTPFGWPNVAWGIDWYKVDWGDGNTQFFPYATSFDPGAGAGLQKPHQYTNLVIGINAFTITVTAIDYLGGETSYSRDISINRTL